MLVLVVFLSALLVQTQTSLASLDFTSFSFSSFGPDTCNSSKLLCMGSVTSGNNGHLSLTPEPSLLPPTRNQIGRVLYPQKVRAWPALITTTFTIRIIPMLNPTDSSDGMTFVFAQDHNPSPSHSYGGFLGLLDRYTQGGSLRQLGVEFDTFKNEFDIDGNHIGIDTTSILSPVAAVSLNPTGIQLKSGREINVKIDYDGSVNMLYVYVGYSGSPLNSVLNHSLDLSNIVPSNVYVGFTASTGIWSESHQVLNWVFTSVPLPLTSHKHKKEDTLRTILIVVVFVLVVLLIGSVHLIRKALRKGDDGGSYEKEDKDLENLSKTTVDIPKVFTFKQLMRATCNFNNDNLIGRGGFGYVYKGMLSDPPKVIAVKKVSATSKQGEREYFAEICTIGRLRHRNIVQLLGWCHEREHLLLVYEYMENGSLDYFIGKETLDWQTRHNILKGLASALVYLHEECGNPVVHRDVKPNNVMLDYKYTAHLGDFGLARLLQNEESAVVTNLAGTPGYLAPEIGFTGKATPESDVYSFGMVVLEVICGKRSKGSTEESSLVDYVWNMHSEDALVECVDKLLRDEFDEEEARRALMVGLACLHPDSMMRPKMRKVLHILMNPNEPLMELPEIKPAGVYVCVSSTTSTTTNFGSKSACPYPVPQSTTTSSEEISIVYDQQ